MNQPLPLPTEEDHHLVVALMMALEGDGLYTDQVRYLLNLAVNEFDPRVVIGVLAWRLGQKWDRPLLERLWAETDANQKAMDDAL